jgi:hypothetical protein
LTINTNHTASPIAGTQRPTYLRLGSKTPLYQSSETACG